MNIKSDDDQTLEFEEELNNILSLSMVESDLDESTPTDDTQNSDSDEAVVGSFALVDEGHTIVVVDYLNPKMTPDNGFDTTGVGVELFNPISELILFSDPIDGLMLTPSPVSLVLPTLSIDDVSVIEPFVDGLEIAKFTVSLSAASTKDVSVSFVTADGTATSDGIIGTPEFDYGSDSGIVTIPAGATSAVIELTVFGDNFTENNEQYRVILSDPINATILDGTGDGTIVEDDLVEFSITALSLNEGSSASTVMEGNVSSYTISYTGVLADGATASVTFDTQTGSFAGLADAIEGVDFVENNSTLIFTGGTGITSAIVFVQSTVDTIVDDVEGYVINLTATSANASINPALDSVGTAIFEINEIINLIGGGDTAAGELARTDVFTWEESSAGTSTISNFLTTDGDNIFLSELGDILYLSDLLIDESSTAESLDAYLDFSLDTGNTVIDVDSDASGTTDLSITITNVDLTNAGALANDVAIINNLLDGGNLITD